MPYTIYIKSNSQHKHLWTHKHMFFFKKHTYEWAKHQIYCLVVKSGGHKSRNPQPHKDFNWI